MKHARPRLTYANVMSSLAVFLVLAGGTAIAAGLAKNSVGPKQLKKGAVTAAKIKDGAVNAGKLAPNAVTANAINVATLPPVPSATNATNATNAQNAQNLNGLFFAVVNANGTLARGTPGVTSIPFAGGYLVSLPGVASTKNCFFVGSLGGAATGPKLGEISLNPSAEASSPNAIFVVVAKSDGEPTSKEFSLMARC